MSLQNGADSHQPDNGDNQEEAAPGWDAISACTDKLYPGQEPKHFGTIISHRLGGSDPLDGISAWKRQDPVPHWHFVTYGFSELYEKETDDLETSGYGFELTFRLTAAPDVIEPPMWPINFLQNLARYVFESGNVFEDGHWMTANGPIALECPTRICSMGFVADPELPSINTPNGSVTFLQVVGLTLDEEHAAKQWQTKKLLQVFLPHMPLWITDLERDSLLSNSSVREQVAEGTSRDGSSSGFLYTDVLLVEEQKRLMRQTITQVTLGARQVDELLALLPLRLPFQRPFVIVGRDWRIRFTVSEQNSVKLEEGVLAINMTVETVCELSTVLQARAGTYELPSFKALQWKVQKTIIKDAAGKLVNTIG